MNLKFLGLVVIIILLNELQEEVYDIDKELYFAALAIPLKLVCSVDVPSISSNVAMKYVGYNPSVGGGLLLYIL